MNAYEDAINRCSAPDAPWHIIPANRKWYRDYVVSKTVARALEDMHLKWPKSPYDLSKIKIV
jgi:polyphosphate kinase 2 (PPK2 family)